MKTPLSEEQIHREITSVNRVIIKLSQSAFH